MTSKRPSELKELQCSGTIRTGLEFIEEKERVVGDELKIGIEQRDVFENRIYLETIVEDVAIFDLLHKVDFDYVLILLGSKVLYGTCFSNLRAPLTMSGLRSGLCEILVDFATDYVKLLSIL